MQCLEGPQRTPQTLLPTFNKGRLSGSCWAHKTPAGIFGAGSFNGRLYQTYLPVTYICNRIFKESDCSNFLIKGGIWYDLKLRCNRVVSADIVVIRQY